MNKTTSQVVLSSLPNVNNTGSNTTVCFTLHSRERFEALQMYNTEKSIVLSASIIFTFSDGNVKPVMESGILLFYITVKLLHGN